MRNSWGQQNLEFKIRNIDLLNELGVKRSKGLQLRLNVIDITPDLIGKIADVCTEFNGNTPLFLKVRDEKENINLELLSRKYRVNPVNDLVKKIKKFADVEVVF
jgi:DNA polymerase-3 subunit alpha